MKPVLINEIRYEVLTARWRDAAIACFASNFVKDEPLARTLGVDADSFRGLVTMLVDDAMPDGLCFVAIDAASEALIGATLARDLERPSPAGLEQACPGIVPVFALMGMLEERYREHRQRPVERGEIVNSMMGAVYPEQRNKEIASLLGLLTVVEGDRRGFTHVIGIPTNSATGHIARRRFGVTPIAEVLCAEFDFEGECVFAGVTDPESVFIFELPLAPVAQAMGGALLGTA